jgi:hypothetical protein
MRANKTHAHQQKPMSDTLAGFLPLVEEKSTGALIDPAT